MLITVNYYLKTNLNKMNIEVLYDGKYPCLCFGNLTVIINNIKWKFPDNCLLSGGSVSFDKDWISEITEGDWVIDKWPEGFPEELKEEVLEKINNTIPLGCCGSCL